MKLKLAVLVFFVAFLSQAQAMPIISISPSAGSFAVGDTVDVAVEVSGLGDGIAPSLGTYDIDFNYDRFWTSV